MMKDGSGYITRGSMEAEAEARLRIPLHELAPVRAAAT